MEETDSQSKVNIKIKKGLKWNLYNQIATQVIFMWFGIYLARLLGPDAFGLVGMVTVLSGFASIFVDFGFASSVIYYKINTKNQLSSIFWFNLLLGIFIYLLFFAAAPLIADFYNEPQLVSLTRMVTIGIVISAFSSLQSTLLTKDINFRKKVIIQWSSTLLSYTVGFYCAFQGYGVWSIVFMSLTASIVTTISLWYTTEWKPSLYFSLSDLKPLLKYSTSVGANSTFSYLTRNADNFIVAKFIGQSALGLYSTAYRIMMLPVSNISSIFSSVLFAGFAKSKDRSHIASIYLKTISVISFVTFPLMVGVYCVATEFINIFYGAEWIEAIPLIKILSLLGAVQSILSLNGILFNAVGKPKLALYATFLFNVILIPSWFLGIKMDGIVGFTLAYFIVSLVGSIFILYNAIRFINLTLIDVFTSVKKPVLGSILIYLSLVIVQEYALTGMEIWFIFVSKVIVGCVVYLVYSLVFQKDIISILKKIKN